MTLRLAVSVEGQTEERFVKDLLAPHLYSHGVAATPVIVATSRSASGRKARGINPDRVHAELQRLLRGFDHVTTLYDFYGFDGRKPRETADRLQARMSAGLGNPRNLIVYVQRHEFEALLLSDPGTAAEYFQAPAMAAEIAKAIATAGSPEDVNDRPETAPSKRLEEWTTRHAPANRRFSKRNKVLHGADLARHITLPVIRRACPRFALWLKRLEALAP